MSEFDSESIDWGVDSLEWVWLFVVVVVVKATGVGWGDAHLHVHDLRFHKSPELGLNLSGS